MKCIMEICRASRSAWLRGARACAITAGAWLLGAGAVLASPESVDELVRLSLQLEPDLPRGAALYGQHCVGCHRKNASGNPGRSIPALAGQREAYLIKQLADFAERERNAEQMHAVISQAALNEPQVWADVAAYVAQLPAVRRPERGNGRRIKQGAAIFAEQCAECHAADARGDADGFVPALRGQHYSYLVGQLRGLAASHRSNVDPEFMGFIEQLQAAQIAAVADYLARLRGPVQDRAQLRDDGAVRN